MSPFMPASPDGHRIENLKGDAPRIIERGRTICQLARKMDISAELLRDVKARSISGDGQKGKAIDKLRETIGDSYQVLEQAADLYRPVGPVILRYGMDLESDHQPKINGLVDECGSLWTTFELLPGSVQRRGAGGLFQPEEGSPEALQNEAEDIAKEAAFNEWRQKAGDFDDAYDCWLEAFNDAADQIGDEMADSIEDGFFRSFLDGFGQVLSWAGIIVGIAALIIGGPILAAIAAAIGIVALLVTIGQACYGDKGAGDIALSVLGIIPFAKLGKLGQLGRSGEFFGDMFKGLKPSTYKDAIAAFKAADGAGPLSKFGNALLNNFRTSNPSLRDFGLRMLTGTNTDERARSALLYAMGDGPGARIAFGPALMRFEEVMTGAGNLLKIDSFIAAATGNKDHSLKKEFPVLDYFW